MTYTFQITGDDSEIFRTDDATATPVILVPVLDGETPASHAARVKSIADAMNAMDDPGRDDRTGSVVNLIEAMHALAAQCWDKAPHESDPEFAEAFVRVGDLLGIHGQDIHEDFDRRAVDAMLGGEWVRRGRTVDELMLRAATIDQGLDMASDEAGAMCASPITQSGDLARAIGRLQSAVTDASENEAHAAGCEVACTAFALHQEAERLRAGTAGDKAIDPDAADGIMAALKERHERYSAGADASSVLLALEVEATMLRIEAMLRPRAA
jgi:hypothetical protein